ncbi:MAG: phosphoenolpyruvate synthase [Deltaproteobacteria bacterium]|nr:phosphoenolpyruvate synthase [Deltaproteobacteria bacterium]
MGNKPYVLWFDEVGLNDLPLVGGKNASLGEMRRELTGLGVSIPNGFAVTVHAYHDFLDEGTVQEWQYIMKKPGVRENIRDILADLDVDNMENLSERGSRVRRLIYSLEFPRGVVEEIIKAYRKLCKEYGEDTDVAVRSSATAEDLPTASFAGQQETYLNIRGEYALIQACKRCFASLFTNRAISYRTYRGFDHFQVALSIGIQKMVRSDKACSGVMFTMDTESGFPHVVYITGSYGLGENIVQGVINPDEFYVFKPCLQKQYKPIIQKILGTKEIKMIYAMEGEGSTKNIPVSLQEKSKFILEEEEIIRLAQWGVIIEEHYSKRAGNYTPMDIEWAKDGITQQLFILQARPETVKSQRNMNVLETYVLKEKGRVLAQGRSVGEKIGAGPVHVLSSAKEIDQFKKGEVLVTQMTDPDWEPIMKIAAGIVTDRGGRTCHAAIISRELGIPCVVGTVNGSEILGDYRSATVSCSEGETGLVFEGILDYEVKRFDMEHLEKPHTRIMMNVGNPDNAFHLSFIPNDGVGLARLEFIINNVIRIHPMALVQFDSLNDDHVRKEIEQLTVGYEDKKVFFIDRLAQGVAKIAAAFYPRDVIVRMSDFKTNEYANLIGGSRFEPVEDNPMIGYRGASRYYDEDYQEGFGLECLAMKKVRGEMGLTNVKLMIPFCRTVEEGRLVIAEMRKYGLIQGQKDLEIYMMCEIPSNVILAEEFSEIFDGFSIGSNDLTQLILGLDRDSEKVARLFDERNPAVKKMVQWVIEKVKKNGKKIGICGQAPSDYPEFAEFLVRCGIDSISLNPDTVIKATERILQVEKELGVPRRKDSEKKALAAS